MVNRDRLRRSDNVRYPLMHRPGLPANRAQEIIVRPGRKDVALVQTEKGVPGFTFLFQRLPPLSPQWLGRLVPCEYWPA